MSWLILEGHWEHQSGRGKHQRIIVSADSIWYVDPGADWTRVEFKASHAQRCGLGVNYMAFIATSVSAIDKLPDFPRTEGGAHD